MPDAKFTSYIDRIKSDFEDGTIDLTYMQLMTKAENKYQSLLISKSGWMQKSKEHDTIVALQAQLSAVTESYRQLEANAASISDSKTPLKAAGQRKRLPKLPDGRPAFEGDAAWRLKLPAPGAPGAPVTKVVKGITWHYCAKHGYWVRHTTEECQLDREHFQPSGRQERRQPSEEQSSIDHGRIMAQMGIVDEIDDSDDN